MFDDVDLLVAPSAALAEEYVRLGLPRGPAAGVPTTASPLDAAPRLARRRPAPLRIGFVGTLVWHKGVHVLLEAARAAARRRLRLDVFGDARHVSRLRRRGCARAAHGLPVRSAVASSARAGAASTRRLDVLVVPSLWLENSPLVIHEAFQAGVAVVGRRIGGIPEPGDRRRERAAVRRRLCAATLARGAAAS